MCGIVVHQALGFSSWMFISTLKMPRNIFKEFGLSCRDYQFFWQHPLLEVIGNKLGTFIALEEYWDTKLDHICAKMQVKLDVREGLFEGIVIEMHGSTWTQKLDYSKIHFRCFLCRQDGLLTLHYPHPDLSRPKYKKI